MKQNNRKQKKDVFIFNSKQHLKMNKVVLLQELWQFKNNGALKFIKLHMVLIRRLPLFIWLGIVFIKLLWKSKVIWDNGWTQTYVNGVVTLPNL